MYKLAMALAVCILSKGVFAEESDRTNIIFLIGDGMGTAYTGAYRLYQDDLATPELDKTIFDEMLVGMATTYPDDHNQVTDSAAAATALASGIKTYNGAIGVNSQRSPVESMLDKARSLGYQTGIAVTCQVNHATPAAFVAHADSRQSYDAIADQYLDLKIGGKPKVDLILGGGREYFIRKDRNLKQEFERVGYSYLSDLQNLKSVKKLPVLGLFSEGGLPPALDSTHPLRLAEMTQKSLELLSQTSNTPKPFLLMLEASQIDWCGHANDIACAMGEMRDMAETMKIIKQFIDKNPNTIFVATADHSTGGLSIGANGKYVWDAAKVRSVKATAPEIASQLFAAKGNWVAVWKKLTQIKLSEDDQKVLDALIVQPDETNGEAMSPQITKQVLALIDKHTSTGWTTKGHTGEDVQIFSYGRDKQNFEGAMDNTDIAKKLINYLH